MGLSLPSNNSPALPWSRMTHSFSFWSYHCPSGVDCPLEIIRWILQFFALTIFSNISLGMLLGILENIFFNSMAKDLHPTITRDSIQQSSPRSSTMLNWYILSPDMLSTFKFTDKLIKPGSIIRIDLITYSKEISTPRFIFNPVYKLLHFRVTWIVKFVNKHLEGNLPLVQRSGHSGSAAAIFHLLVGRHNMSI